jgi:hypothetical protein
VRAGENERGNKIVAAVCLVLLAGGATERKRMTSDVVVGGAKVASQQILGVGLQK